MKLEENSAEVLVQGEGLEGIYRQIERAGRTCYKSEDKMDETPGTFALRMINSKHLSMLEHGAVYLKVPKEDKDVTFLITNPYTVSVMEYDYLYASTNFRVIIENNKQRLLDYLCEPTEYHHLRITIKFVTNIGVSRELNRHRANSIAEQSTRYCNYTKDKFGNGITTILPSELPELVTPKEADSEKILSDLVEVLNDSDMPYVPQWEIYAFSQAVSDMLYKHLIRRGVAPQSARCVLPLMTKTEVVHTAFVKDWVHFFDLRYFNTTGNSHPDMYDLAGKAREALIKANNLWDILVAYKHEQEGVKHYAGRYCYVLDYTNSKMYCLNTEFLTIDEVCSNDDWLELYGLRAKDCEWMFVDNKDDLVEIENPLKEKRNVRI